MVRPVLRDARRETLCRRPELHATEEMHDCHGGGGFFPATSYGYRSSTSSDDEEFFLEDGVGGRLCMTSSGSWTRDGDNTTDDDDESPAEMSSFSPWLHHPLHRGTTQSRRRESFSPSEPFELQPWHGSFKPYVDDACREDMELLLDCENFPEPQHWPDTRHRNDDTPPMRPENMAMELCGSTARRRRAADYSVAPRLKQTDRRQWWRVAYPDLEEVDMYPDDHRRSDSRGMEGSDDAMEPTREVTAERCGRDVSVEPADLAMYCDGRRRRPRPQLHSPHNAWTDRPKDILAVAWKSRQRRRRCLEPEENWDVYPDPIDLELQYNPAKGGSPPKPPPPGFERMDALHDDAVHLCDTDFLVGEDDMEPADLDPFNHHRSLNRPQRASTDSRADRILADCMRPWAEVGRRRRRRRRDPGVCAPRTPPLRSPKKENIIPAKKCLTSTEIDFLSRVEIIQSTLRQLYTGTRVQRRVQCQSYEGWNQRSALVSGGELRKTGYVVNTPCSPPRLGYHSECLLDGVDGEGDVWTKSGIQGNIHSIERKSDYDSPQERHCAEQEVKNLGSPWTGDRNDRNDFQEERCDLRRRISEHTELSMCIPYCAVSQVRERAREDVRLKAHATSLEEIGARRTCTRPCSPADLQKSQRLDAPNGASNGLRDRLAQNPAQMEKTHTRGLVELHKLQIVDGTELITQHENEGTVDHVSIQREAQRESGRSGREPNGGAQEPWIANSTTDDDVLAKTETTSYPKIASGRETLEFPFERMDLAPTEESHVPLRATKTIVDEAVVFNSVPAAPSAIIEAQRVERVENCVPIQQGGAAGVTSTAVAGTGPEIASERNSRNASGFQLEGPTSYTELALRSNELMKLLHAWQLQKKGPVECYPTSGGGVSTKTGGMVDLTCQSGYMSQYVKTQAMRARQNKHR